jgi:hypothetical protein
MTIEMPTGGRIEAELMPVDDPSLPLSVKLGKSGDVVYTLPAMLEDGILRGGMHTWRTGHHGGVRDSLHRQPTGRRAVEHQLMLERSSANHG